jgi:hypothetical protein
MAQRHAKRCATSVLGDLHPSHDGIWVGTRQTEPGTRRGKSQGAAGSDCGPPCGRAGCGASAKPVALPLSFAGLKASWRRSDPAIAEARRPRSVRAGRDAQLEAQASRSPRGYRRSSTTLRLLRPSSVPASGGLELRRSQSPPDLAEAGGVEPEPSVRPLVHRSKPSLDEATENEKAPVNRGLSLVGPPGFEPGTNGL